MGECGENLKCSTPIVLMIRDWLPINAGDSQGKPPKNSETILTKPKDVKIGKCVKGKGKMKTSFLFQLILLVSK